MAEKIRCAVVGCTDSGRPQICPYDGSYHHHGCIHYGTIPSVLTFHQEAWDWLCTSHYNQLVIELDTARPTHREVLRVR